MVVIVIVLITGRSNSNRYFLAWQWSGSAGPQTSENADDSRAASLRAT